MRPFAEDAAPPNAITPTRAHLHDNIVQDRAACPLQVCRGDPVENYQPNMLYDDSVGVIPIMNSKRNRFRKWNSESKEMTCEIQE